MHKFIIPVAAAGAAFMLASPASAQWARQPYAYQAQNYQRTYNPYGYSDYRYGRADANFAASMRSRVQGMRSNIQSLRMQRVISPREARRLDNEAVLIERHIYMASRNGIQPRDMQNLDMRVQRLERNIALESSDRNNRPGRYYRRG